jgi:hypothetical protein
MRPRDEYTRNATLLYWHDADTCRVFIDLGYNNWQKAWIRLEGYDAPEKYKQPISHARATARAEELCPPGSTVVIQTLRPLAKSFDRWIGHVWPPAWLSETGPLARNMSQILTDEHLTKADFQ